jgi:hypothetical protein
MELQFPADAPDALVRSGRNISDTERWVSVAAGTLIALRPVTPPWVGLDAGVPRRAAPRRDGTLSHLRSARREYRGHG